MAITSHFHEWDVRRGSPGQGLCLGLAAVGALRLVMSCLHADGDQNREGRIERRLGSGLEPRFTERGAGYSSALLHFLCLSVSLSPSLPSLSF